MANSPVIPTAQQFWGLKRETTPGTYAAPSAAQDFLFVTSGQIEDIVEDVYDESNQGSYAKQQGYYQGVQQAKVTLKGHVAQASSGHLFRAAMGAISESGAGDPYTHNFLLRSAPGPTYSIIDFDGTISNVRAVKMARCQSLKVSYSNVQKFLDFEAVFIGIWTDVAQTKMSATFDAALHYLAWQGALTYGGAATDRLLSMTLHIDNEVGAVPGSSGSQAINDVYQNQCSVLLDLLFRPTDGTEYALYRANTQQAFSLLFTQAAHSLTLQVAKLALPNGAKLIQTGKYVTLQAKGAGINNATDAGPAKIILLNAIATGSY
jgi:hypothetical protein